MQQMQAYIKKCAPKEYIRGRRPKVVHQQTWFSSYERLWEVWIWKAFVTFSSVHGSGVLQSLSAVSIIIIITWVTRWNIFLNLLKNSWTNATCSVHTYALSPLFFIFFFSPHTSISPSLRLQGEQTKEKLI